MKLYYCPTFNNTTYVDYSKHEGMLWDSAVVGTNALLDQLLLRFGLTQTPAEETDVANEARKKLYELLLTDNWIKDSRAVDPEGTVEQVLVWRDCLIMEGWKSEMTQNAKSQKLSSLSRWEKGFDKMQYPGRADLWRLLADTKIGESHVNLEIEVCIPKSLVPQLIVEVLEKVSNVKYLDFNDTQLKTEGRKITVVKEQYEAWQLAALQNLKEDTIVVCENDNRLNNTLKGLKSESFDIGNAHCIHPTDDITNQLDAPKNIVWLDCAGNKGSAYRFGFLTNAEIDELKKAGLILPKHEDMSKANQQWQTTLLNRAENVELIVPKYEDGELMPEHSVVTELKNSGVKSQAPDEMPLTTDANVLSFTPTDYVNLDLDFVSKLEKGKDSASSLGTLFQRPFDYFMEYMLGLTAPEDDAAEKINIVEGKVAHKVVELMLKGHEGKRDDFVAEWSNYDSHLENALDSEGVLLQEPENINELAVFTKELRDSIKVLCDIITNLNLTPRKCEMEFNKKLEIFENPHGYIDMVLTDENEDYVIFDFKYSSSKSYSESLAANQSLQLTYYIHAFENEIGKKETETNETETNETEKKVVWCGYYLFPKQTLYTQNKNLEGRNNVEVVENAKGAPADADFWEMIKNTYNFRMGEIDGGKIEEGEGFSVNDLDISKSTSKLIEIGCDKDEKDKKSTNFCKYRTKDELLQRPTSHTILKNHLK